MKTWKGVREGATESLHPLLHEKPVHHLTGRSRRLHPVGNSSAPEVVVLSAVVFLRAVPPQRQQLQCC